VLVVVDASPIVERIFMGSAGTKMRKRYRRCGLAILASASRAAASCGRRPLSPARQSRRARKLRAKLFQALLDFTVGEGRMLRSNARRQFFPSFDVGLQVF
jgi:hypothetical protein